MKICFLIYNVYGIGGTIRSTVNLSGALAAAGHTVEIASVYRNQDRPALDLAPGVTVRPLIEWRRGKPGCARRHVSAQLPSTMWQDSGVAFGGLAPSRLTDERVAAHLRATDADVVVATRPILNGYLARYGERRYLRVGQEHVLMEMHNDQQRTDQNRALAELDAFVTVSRADADHYRAALPDVATRITAIPNAVPLPEVDGVPRPTRTVVAAGRLTKVKRYDRLIDAFAKVAPSFPDWSLRIYGRGRQAAGLQRQINRLGLHNQVRLMGPVSPIETEWAKGEIAAVSSDNESFGMTIVEAMHCGLPVVATDCPYGPGEILNHGRDGLLVPLRGGSDAFADALWILMSGAERRRAMGAEAEDAARRYAPPLVAEQYLRLFAELAAARGPEAELRPRGPVRRLRDAVRTVLRSGPPRLPAPRAEERAPRGPGARAAVAPDGSILVRVAVDDLPDRPLDLVLRHRKNPDRPEVRLPLPPRSTAAGGRVEVALDRAAHTLAEGRWDCYLADRPGGGGPTAEPRRLRAELVEQAELLTLGLGVTEAGVAHWIPYPTVEGNLSVRTWLRPAHAEVHEVTVGPRSLTVAATLHRAAPAAGARAAGARGQAPAEPTVRAVRRSDGRAVTAPVEQLPGDRLRFTLPLGGTAASPRAVQDLWDLRLRLAGTTAAVPVGRIAGDTVDRKATDVVPAARVPAPGGGESSVRPYFTAGNALALSVRPVPRKTDTPHPSDGPAGPSDASDGKPLAA